MKAHLTVFGATDEVFEEVFMFLFDFYMKFHLTIFVKKGEVVKDVGAEHDVLSRVHPQHNWHLVSSC